MGIMRGKRALALVVCAALGPAMLGADPVTESWSRVYRWSDTLAQRYEIMQSIVTLDNRDFVPLLMEALAELLDVRESRTRSEEVLRESLMRLAVQELGELKASESADLLMRVVREAQDPPLRSVALAALGYVGGRQYAGEVALMLRNLNLYHGTGVAGEETLVWGCVTALGRFGDPVGYEPVFFALHVGYSSRISALAGRALGAMLEDPTDILQRIVRDEGDRTVKLLALRQELSSRAPAAGKVQVATEALQQGLNRTAANRTEATQLASLRVEAMQATTVLAQGGAAPDRQRVSALLARVLALDTDVGELLAATDTLRALGGDESVGVLTAYLKTANDRQDSGLNAPAEQLRVIISVIRALGELGSPLASAELLRVQYIKTYANSVIKEAREAAAKIR